MWLWPTFARDDKLKRNILTAIVIVLAGVLLFVVAPIASTSITLTLIALAAFIVVGLTLRFLPVSVRLRTIRRAASAFAAQHRQWDIVIANVYRVPVDTPITTRDPYQTRLMAIEADEVSLWNPDDLSTPVLSVARTDIAAADPDAASPPRLRLVVVPRSGEPAFVVAVTVFRPTGSSPASRETLRDLGRRLLTPRSAS